MTVVNGTIQGGNGAAGNPDGAVGVDVAAAGNAPQSVKLIVGAGAKILGGNGANAKDNSGLSGGNGGVGIQGAITVEVLTDGIVKGGNGGNGANVTEGAPADTKAGFGGEGGKGVALTNGEPTAQPGTIQDGTAGLDGTAAHCHQSRKIRPIPSPLVVRRSLKQSRKEAPSAINLTPWCSGLKRKLRRLEKNSKHG